MYIPLQKQRIKLTRFDLGTVTRIAFENITSFYKQLQKLSKNKKKKRKF